MKMLTIVFTIVAIQFGYAHTVVHAQGTSSGAQAQASNSRSSVETSIANNICKGVLATQETNVPANTTVQNCDQDSQKEFSDVVKRIINIFSIVVGAVSVIMIIIGGFRYIVSGGDSSGVGAAKNTILYAIVGLVIVLFAQVMVRFVVSRLSPAQTNNTQGTTAEFQQQVTQPSQ